LLLSAVWREKTSNMKTIATFLFTVIVSAGMLAQVAPQKYFIGFRDKAGSPWSVSRPEEFLSARSVERRQKQGIPVTEEDLPVNQGYLNTVANLGAKVLTCSKWFNGVTVLCTNPAIIDSINKLTFVTHVEKDALYKYVNNYISDYKFTLEEPLHEVTLPFPIPANGVDKSNGLNNYGSSFTQIHMLRGDSLHKLGFRGEGMVIAILDAGFYHANTLRAFDSLIANNQILGTRDFVNPGNNVYQEYEHGMEVLSCMGANLPGELIGTAPKAGFWLLRSEDAYSENLIEEYNWVSAAEFADSVGADIINSSLGYTHFDDTLANHTCADMSGNTTPVTRGANIAFSKGMIVVNSAGNSGGSSWKCVSAPADGFNVVAVAAVDSGGNRAGFSSTGEATHRVKPNVAAMGRLVVVSSTVGPITHSSGTSFASPILAGLTACLWQAAPGWSNTAITRAIELSGNQVSNPDSLLGYGIPDFIKAMKIVSVPENSASSSIRVYPNPFHDFLALNLYSDRENEVTATLCDLYGRQVAGPFHYAVTAGENRVMITGLYSLKSGSYLLQIAGAMTIHAKVVKIR